MSPARLRGRVAIVTPFWGEDENEQIAVTRLIAGALARDFHVDVLHLDENSSAQRTRPDSAFWVHTFPLSHPHHLQIPLLRLALGLKTPDAPLPTTLERNLSLATTITGDVVAKIDQLAPDAIVCVGATHPYDLERFGEGSARRIIFIPLIASATELHGRDVARMMAKADLIVASHPGELETLSKRFPEREKDIVPLDLALSVNRGATGDTLFGVRFFQPFVLVIRSFADDRSRRDETVTHEIITSVAGTLSREDVPATHWRTTDETVPAVLPISVAEVDGVSWRLSDNINMLPLPVSPTRVNLWRLMAHALFMVDLRSPTAFGRETLESLMFDSPVIVPDSSAAKAHAKAANAGLWYQNNGELLDSVRVLTDRSMREQLARNGRRYVDAHHSDLAGFVERICSLVVPRHSSSVARGDKTA